MLVGMSTVFRFLVARGPRLDLPTAIEIRFGRYGEVISHWIWLQFKGGTEGKLESSNTLHNRDFLVRSCKVYKSKNCCVIFLEKVSEIYQLFNIWFFENSALPCPSPHPHRGTFRAHISKRMQPMAQMSEGQASKWAELSSRKWFTSFLVK